VARAKVAWMSSALRHMARVLRRLLPARSSLSPDSRGACAALVADGTLRLPITSTHALDRVSDAIQSSRSPPALSGSSPSPSV